MPCFRQEKMETATVVDSEVLLTDFYHVSEGESDKEDSHIKEILTGGCSHLLTYLWYQCSDVSCNEEDKDNMEEETQQVKLYNKPGVEVLFQGFKYSLMCAHREIGGVTLVLQRKRFSSSSTKRRKEREHSPQVTRAHKKFLLSNLPLL